MGGEKLEKLLHQILDEMRGMKAEIKDVKANVADFRNEVNERFHRVEEGQARLEANQLKIESHIENKISKEIGALFDGWKQNTEQLSRIEEKVSTHEEFIIKRIK